MILPINWLNWDLKCPLIGPKPAYGISAGIAKKAVRDWTETIKNNESP
jgi:hypothetical protein